VVVGDGALGLLGILSARQMGADRIIAMSRHEKRQRLAREFGATDLIPERGDEGVKRIMDMTRGVGADSVMECVGTQLHPNLPPAGGLLPRPPLRPAP
jgi:threonine dehydrogenase-like Zn-dependent dehydrogenase